MNRITTRLRELADLPKKGRYAWSFLRDRLIHTNLQLLYRCNFRCRICDFWEPQHQTRPMLSLEQVRVIADRLAEVGPQIVSIGGGEPLLHPEIVEVVRTLARRHFPVMICNGWFVTPERARALFAAGMYEISVSVDYADPARHDAQRGMPGAFDRAFRALEVLNRNRTRPDQRVHLISVILDDNLDEVEPLIRRCRQLGITYLVTLYSDSRGCKPHRSVGAEVSPRLLELKRRYPEFVALRGYVGRFSEAIRDHGIGPCRAGRNLCNIDSQGEVALCIDRLDEAVGNILREPMAVLVERLRERQRTNTCRSCWTSCRGAIETLLHTRRPGDFLDYYQMTRELPLAEG